MQRPISRLVLEGAVLRDLPKRDQARYMAQAWSTLLENLPFVRSLYKFTALEVYAVEKDEEKKHEEVQPAPFGRCGR